MKKLVSLLLTIVLLSTLVATSAFAEDKVTIEILSLKNEQAAQDAGELEQDSRELNALAQRLQELTSRFSG